MEITLFFGDERILTTITDESGKRLVGTKADSQTVKWVLETGRKYFSKNVEIGGEQYFGYYVPILNKDKSVVGMAFAGKKRAEVLLSIWESIMSSVLICVLILVATILICVVSSQKIIDALKRIMEYLGFLAQGDFSQKMPKYVQARNDEIGDMGKYAEKVSRSLEEMITTDPLTKLYNRRACKKYLEKRMEKCEKRKENLITIALGDIDHFKKINDTYGHDCGDMVLVTVSDIFKKHMKDDGCVARWGGEEFLLVFDKEKETAQEMLCAMLKEIKEHEFVYKDQKFRITFTFGINAEILGLSFDEIINSADECLYRGKTDGRDRIVVTDGKVIEL
jgi:diguanylate cyclase (GGDEF)-like protein